MDVLPKYSYIHKFVYDNQVQKPSLAIGNLVPKDWHTLKEWENQSYTGKFKRVGSGMISKMKDISNNRKDKYHKKETTQEKEIKQEKNSGVEKSKQKDEKR